jgi:hypothetical protein
MQTPNQAYFLVPVFVDTSLSELGSHYRFAEQIVRHQPSFGIRESPNKACGKAVDRLRLQQTGVDFRDETMPLAAEGGRPGLPNRRTPSRYAGGLS